MLADVSNGIEYCPAKLPVDAIEPIDKNPQKAGNPVVNAKLIDEVTEKTGLNLRSSNNKYHLQLEGKSPNYSQDMVDLLRKVKDSEPFKIELLDRETVSWPPRE